MMIVRQICLMICGGWVLAGVLVHPGTAFENVRPLPAAVRADLSSDDSGSDDSNVNGLRPTDELKWAVSQPSPDGTSMLQRFVDECVQISKGTLIVPRTALDSELAKQLVIERSYRICRFETTQELFRLVMGTNPSRWPGPRNSVEQITYSDAVRFCEKLTAMLRSGQLISQKQMVRLPTDVEWEYACRAGATTKYCFGDSGKAESGERILDEYAWHRGNAAGNDPSVGKLKPNRWKLADIHGYLWEFTQLTPRESITRASSVRIWGGSWRASPLECGCSSIRQVSATFKAPDLGFRCVIQ